MYLNQFFWMNNLPMISILLIWSLVWKGIALWKSARANKPIWFVVLLVVNTLGILEILYIYIFSNLGKNKTASASKKGSEDK